MFVDLAICRLNAFRSETFSISQADIVVLSRLNSPQPGMSIEYKPEKRERCILYTRLPSLMVVPATQLYAACSRSSWS
jgi:hypothetical protein